MWKHYQALEPAIQDQGYSWQSISCYMYWFYRLTGKKEVRVDEYNQYIPIRKMTKEDKYFCIEFLKRILKKK